MAQLEPKRGGALAAVALAQFMVTLDMTIVNVALPSLGGDLGFEPTQLPWVVNVYALLFGGLLMLGGRAADLFGQRRILLSGTALFALASLAGGLAQAPWQLIAARAVQGMGAALMAPAALALLTLTQREGRERTRALGVYAAVSAVGGAAGVLSGGLLTQFAGWRWVMLVNVPMAACVVVLALIGVPGGQLSSGPRRTLDVPGAVLVTGGVGALVLGLLRTDHYGWASATTLVTLGIAVLLIVLFLLWEARGIKSDPLIRLGLLAKRNVAGANLFILLLCAGQFAAFYFISLYLQDVLHLDAARAGAAFLPLTLTVVVAINISTRLVPRLGPKPLLVTGGLLAAAGFAWFGALDADGGFLTDLLGPSLLTGLGMGLSFVPLTGAAVGGLPRHEAGMASAVLNSSRQIGGALGLAALVTAQASRTDARLAAGDPPLEALTSGFGIGLSLSGALLLAAALVALIVLPGKRAAGVPAGEPAAQRGASSSSPWPTNAPAGSPPLDAASSVTEPR
ncbi:MFS transporter [Actinoplanes sp. SE50]|uniref:DHA2 family efflux MFS transporter permease subunit n=1 Tax=unclassified Actinoplanes TaxID=2626549 RepID=UPI00023EC6BD|nr:MULTISPECIES: DHA2 family efflux MFS transporter permease subunit [unclassified Actinoplanes]AEV87046.1 Multidrug resistance protein B [Actinoplanes sp. SE50/110]ATO85444.1 MFS transporter [Actinoplanes sp. SE50]SLM02856.1 MFS drug resistance transporter, EmrB/QacA subfamily [Actinoplanes sp. SE50/110]